MAGGGRWTVRVGRMLSAALATWIAVAAAGCGDVFNFDVDLTPQTFTLDFGQQSGTVPAIACNDAIVQQACASSSSFTVDTTSSTGTPSQVDVALGCDANGQCFAEASARVAQAVSVLQDDSLSSRIGRHALGLVMLADIAYTVPANTMSIEIPKIDIYAGPAGSQRETDPGVAVVGSTQPIPAGTVMIDAQHLIIDDNTPARPVIEQAIEDQQDFVFIVVATPRMDAGSPVPAGSVQVDIFPRIKVGF
jgi:hypothetical protein